jgi:cysteine-rich repeat protein
MKTSLSLVLVATLACGLGSLAACIPDARSGGDGGQEAPDEDRGSDDGGAAGDDGSSDGCAAPIALSCASGALSLDTATGGQGVDGYACDPLFPQDYRGKELVFAFSADTPADVTIGAIKTSAGATTYRLFLLEGDPCAGEVGCRASQDNTLANEATEALRFQSVPGAVTYLAYDVRAADSTTTLELTVSCAATTCGNGVLEAGESCDDGNQEDNDGCSATCTVESGFACSDEPSLCLPVVCGDGVLSGDETCDDGNQEGGDGCSVACAVEPGFTCLGAPSVCVPAEGTCESPPPLVAGAALSHTTVGAPSDRDGYGDACPYHSFAGPEVVHAIEVPPGEALRATLTAESGYPASIVVTEGCGDEGTCQGFSKGRVAYVNRESVSREVFLTVDGMLPAHEGQYTLEAELLAPSDFPAGDLCDNAVPLTLPSTVTGDTAPLLSLVPRWRGQCGFVDFGGRSGGGRDAFYAVTLPPAATLRAELSDVAAGVDPVLLVFTSCADPAGTCLKDVDDGSSGQGEVLEFTNTTGVESDFFLVVDGVSGDNATAFTLTVSLL